MHYQAFLEYLNHEILSIQKDKPAMVGIDGFSASGKTTLARELSQYLLNKGYSVIVSSIDYFHHPEEVRYQKGKLSPAGFYYDSFNIEALKKLLLEPLSSGLPYQKAYFDHESDQPVDAPVLVPSLDSIFIFEGLFLLQDSLINYWDLSIYLKIDYETYMKRNLERYRQKHGHDGDLEFKLNTRYYPGQKIYLTEVNPMSKADVLVDYNNFKHPEILN